MVAKILLLSLFLFSFSLVILTCQYDLGNCEVKTQVQVLILFVFWGGRMWGVLRLPSIILGTYSGDTLLWDNPSSRTCGQRYQTEEPLYLLSRG